MTGREVASVTLNTLEGLSKQIGVVAICAAPWLAHAQGPRRVSAKAPEDHISRISVCSKTKWTHAASAALRLVCQRAPTSPLPASASTAQLIVIGFVGGFVKPGDLHHPEVLFASYLQERYGKEIRARVFSNHDPKDALSYVRRVLDTNDDDVLSSAEREGARIIVYGHSWGASETAVFARELQRLDIPVLLTVQLDIIAKPGQTPTQIPANVVDAINFYQTKGPLHGRQKIIATDPELTTILGNVRMEYTRSAINCSNYNWFVRTFNRPHHEIENDPRIWDWIATLIRARLSNAGRTVTRTHTIASGGLGESSSSTLRQESAWSRAANSEGALRNP